MRRYRYNYYFRLNRCSVDKIIISRNMVQVIMHRIVIKGVDNT